MTILFLADVYCPSSDSGGLRKVFCNKSHANIWAAEQSKLYGKEGYYDVVDVDFPQDQEGLCQRINEYFAEE